MPSSVIAKYSYDDSARELVVQYQSGLVYRYLGVPPEVYLEMKRFMSKGYFLNKHIKGKYEFVKVPSPG